MPGGLRYNECVAREHDMANTLPANIKRQVEFMVRCSVRRGRSLDQVIATARREFGHGRGIDGVVQGEFRASQAVAK